MKPLFAFILVSIISVVFCRREAPLVIQNNPEDGGNTNNGWMLKLCDNIAQDDFASYITINNEDEDKPDWTAKVKRRIKSPKAKRLKSVLILEEVSSEALAGFAEMEEVCGIFEDGTVKTNSYNWGPDRIDQEELPLDGYYSSLGSNGTGVDVYIIDTGIDTGHDEFSGYSRTVANVWSVFNDGCDPACDDDDDVEDVDDNGHGTHVAAIVGGITVGVASNANLYGIKALDGDGVGTWSAVLNAMAWIEETMYGPTVVSCSIGGIYSSILNEAVDDLYDAGATVIVAAGNTATNACTLSPASADGAITVGATTETDLVADYSAYGACVDLYAPGSEIVSALAGTSSTYISLSGTSMACPHVSGAAALVLSADESADVKAALQCASLSGHLDSVLLDAWSDDAIRTLLHIPATGSFSYTCDDDDGD